MKKEMSENPRLVFPIIPSDLTDYNTHVYLELIKFGEKYYFRFFDDGERGNYRRKKFGKGYVTDLYEADIDGIENLMERVQKCINEGAGAVPIAGIRTLRGIIGGVTLHRDEDDLTISFIAKKYNNKGKTLNQFSCQHAFYCGETHSRRNIETHYYSIGINYIDNNDKAIDPEKYELRDIKQPNFLYLWDETPHAYGVEFLEKGDSDKPKWIILNANFDCYRTEFEQLWVEEDNFMFQNSIDPDDDSLCYGGKISKHGLSDVKILYKINDDHLSPPIPVESLPGYDPSKLHLKGSWGDFGMKCKVDEWEYNYSGMLLNGNMVRAFNVVVKRDAPTETIKDEKKLEFDNEKLLKFARETREKANEMFAGAKFDSFMTRVYQEDGSNLGVYSSKSNNKRYLVQKTKDGYSSITDVDEPIYIEYLPNGDIMVVQEDKTVVVLDKKTKMPKTYVRYDEAEKVTLTIVGSKNDYELIGKIDKETGKIQKLTGVIETPACNSHFMVDISDVTTLDEVIGLSQEKIAFYGGKPAKSGKRKRRG